MNVRHATPAWILVLISVVSAIRADQVVPIVGSVAGANDSVFRSDLKLYNPTDETITGTLVLTPRGQSQSGSDPSIPYTLAPRQTMVWTNVYDAILPGQEGAGRLLIATGSFDPIVSTSTYTKLADGGELGQVPTPFAASDVHADTTLAGIVQKPGQRYNGFVITGPEGATIEYTARSPSAGQTFTATASYGPNATYQLVGGPIPGLPDNSSLEVKILVGSARYAGNNIDNLTNQGAWEDYRPVGMTSLPRIIGIDYDGDGVVDNPDANGDGIIDRVIGVDCNPPFPWQGTLIVEPKGNYIFFGGNLPQGMTYTQDTGRITYAPPCTTAGSVFTPAFIVSGNEQNAMIVQFRVN